MMIIRSFLIFTGFLCLDGLFAQGFQTVFPGLTGAPLIDSVSKNYRPSFVLDYANARDTLYASILSLDDDSLRCIYSGHTLYLAPGQDPTQYIYQNGGVNGMNTEHAYPVAKGATQGTNAHSDMHHLYPTRIAVNEARADKPYQEIPDPQTQKWFKGNQVLLSIPSQQIELYAEQGANGFEPRESSKGDVARSVFYFYTVYRNQANLADPNYFNLQRSNLCQWHLQDPVDQQELVKTWKIAGYQEGKPNPYVLDCTLALRAWCPELSSVCQVNTTAPNDRRSLQVRILGSSGGGALRFEVMLPDAGRLSYRLYDLLGRELGPTEQLQVASGLYRQELAWKGEGLFMAVLQLEFVTSQARYLESAPLILSR